MSAELTGFSTSIRENVSVRAGLNLAIDFALSVGALAESVKVTADNPLLEASGATQAVNDQQRDAAVAAARRSSPLVGIPAARAGRGLARFDGEPGRHVLHPWRRHRVVLDAGRRRGHYFRRQPVAGLLGAPDETAADVQIKTNGFDAATPLGMAAASNLVLKSGTNALRGSGTFGYTNKEWIGRNSTGTPEYMSLTQPEASIGGPILQDRLFFFGAYRYRSGKIGIGRPVEQVANMLALSPGFEPFDNEISAHIGIVKLTAQLNAQHQVSGFYNRDATPYGSNGTFLTGDYQRTTLGGQAVAFRTTSAWNSWLTSRFGASWNDKGALTEFVDTGLTSRPVFRSAFISAGQLVGNTQLATLDNIASASRSPYRKVTINGDITAFKTGWIGSHEFQAGLFLQPMKRRDEIIHANGGFGLEELVLRDASNPAAGTMPFHRRIYDAGSGLLAAGTFADNAFYVQDAWRPIERLTINAGLRIDHVTRQDDLFDIELQNSWEIGPRFGVNYMVTRISATRSAPRTMRGHDAASINAQSASGAGTQGTGAQTIGYRDIYDLNLDGVFDTTFVTPAASPVSPNRIIDPDYHQPFVDEFAFGYRRQLPGRLAFDIGYMHRAYRDRTALVEQNGIYDGGVFRGVRNEALNDIFLLTSNEWNWPVYQAVELIVTKATSRFQILGSYTRAFSHMAGTWQPNDPASFIQPGAFENNRGLDPNDNRSASVNNAYSAGTSGFEWLNHIARASVVYRAPWDFQVATNYSIQRGRWGGLILNRIATADPRFGPTTVTRSNGGRDESAGDDDPVRERESRRGSVPARRAAHPEPARRPPVRLRRGPRPDGRSRHLQPAEPRRLPGLARRREPDLQHELRQGRRSAAAARISLGLRSFRSARRIDEDSPLTRTAHSDSRSVRLADAGRAATRSACFDSKRPRCRRRRRGGAVTAIVGATVIDGNGGAPLQNATVVVTGSRITAVGPKASVTVPPGANVIDGAGKFVTPGFVDTNVHLSLYGGGNGGANDRYETAVKYWDRAPDVTRRTGADAL